MYNEASNFVYGVDKAFYIILGIAFFFLIGITALMVYFIIKYNKKRNPKPTQIKDNMLLETTWTIVPLILVLLMFYYGYIYFLPLRKVPKDAMVVKTTGMMWKWIFEYPNGKQSNELIVPLNKPVKLNLISKDVIHGLFIPAYRLKEDVVPGKNNYTWFIPQKLGNYDIFCSYYCGVQHSFMSSLVKVVPEDEFNKWVVSEPLKLSDSDDPGYKILESNGCLGCHSTKDEKLAGPSFKGLYGSEIEIETDGVKRKIRVDDDYIRTSILKADKDVVVGFKPIMQSYDLSSQDILLINQYLKTLSDK